MFCIIFIMKVVGKCDIPKPVLSPTIACSPLSPEPDDVDQKREFFDEIAMMKTVGFHRNIVNLVGCCTITEPLCLIQEFVPCGDLLHYLRERRTEVRLIDAGLPLVIKSHLKSLFCFLQI